MNPRSRHLRLSPTMSAVIWFALTLCGLSLYPIYSTHPEFWEQVVWPAVLGIAGCWLSWRLVAGSIWQRTWAVATLLLWLSFLICWGNQIYVQARLTHDSAEVRALGGVNAVHDCMAANLLDYTNSTLDSEALLRLLIDGCRKDFRGKLPDVQFMEDGTVADLWGRPLRIQIIDRGASGRKPQIKVWSLGKNGRDENGRGDDLVSRKD